MHRSFNFFFSSYLSLMKNTTQVCSDCVQTVMKMCVWMPPAYRCVTSRRWGTSGSDSIGICYATSCEFDSEDHSDRTPALTWWCVWRNPVKKRNTISTHIVTSVLMVALPTLFQISPILMHIFIPSSKRIEGHKKVLTFHLIIQILNQVNCWKSSSTPCLLTEKYW